MYACHGMVMLKYVKLLKKVNGTSSSVGIGNPHGQACGIGTEWNGNGSGNGGYGMK